MEPQEKMEHERAIRNLDAEQLTASLTSGLDEAKAMIAGELARRLFVAESKVPPPLSAADVKRIAELPARELYDMTNLPQPADAYQAIAKVLFARMMRSGQQVRDLRAFLIDQTADAARLLLADKDPHKLRGAQPNRLAQIADVARTLNAITTSPGGPYAID